MAEIDADSGTFGEVYVQTPPPASLTRELSTAIGDVVRGELSLAAAELKDAISQSRKCAAQLMIFGGLAVLGLLPLLAACVIGLGDLLGQRYGWSALIVAAFCLFLGGGLAYRAYRRIDFRKLSLPNTRETVSDGVAETAETVTRKIHRIKDIARRHGG